MLPAILFGVASIAPALAQAPSDRVCDEGALRARLTAEPRRAAIADGRISVLIPEGLRALTGDELPRSMKSGAPGEENLAFGNGEGAAIFMSLKAPEDALSAADLADPDFRKMMSGLLEAMAPGVELTNELVTRNGARWLRIAPARGRSVGSKRNYAALLVTTFQGTSVMAMFIAIEGTGLQAAVQRSAESLEVHDCRLPRGEG